MWSWTLSASRELPCLCALEVAREGLLTSGHPCPSCEHKRIWEFTPVFRGSWMVGAALVSWSPCTQHPPTSTMRSSETRVDSRVFLAESSMKSEEISSSTPTSFLAMQVYAPVSSYRTLPMCSSLPLAGGRTVLKMVCLAGTPSPHQSPFYPE